MSEPKTNITRTRGPAFFKQMSVEQIDALEEFARHPAKTVDECHAWLADAQVRCGRSAVGRWVEDFRVWDKANRGAESRAAYVELTDKLDPGGIAKATHRMLGERIFEMAMNAADPDTIDKLTRSHQRIVGVLDQLEERDLKIARLEAEKIEAARAAETAAKSGASATDVVATIKAALGIAA